ncbi:MAG: tape measure protein [Desulfotomaculales bacterium]
MILGATIRLKDEFSPTLTNAFKSTTKLSDELKAINKTKVKPEVKVEDATITQAIAKMRILSKMVARPVIRFKDEISGQISRIKSGLMSLQGLAMMGLGALGVGKLWEATVGYAGNLEQATMAFTTMLGSAEKAKSFIEELQNFAARTPFEFPQLQDATKRMLAFGFSAEEVLPTLTAIGDAASGLGLGAEGIDRITLAIGQMRAKSKVSADEMLQLTEAGVPAWEILAKKMGATTAEVMKLSEKGLIPADEAIKMLVEGMEERFPGMMQKQSRTYLGLMSTIRDNVKMTLGELGRGILESLEPRLMKITDWFDKNQDTVRMWRNKLVSLGRETFEGILTWGEGFLSKLKTRFEDPGFEKLDWGGKLGVMMDMAASIALPKAGEIGAKIGLAVGSGILSGLSQAANENKLLGLIISAYAGWKMPGPPIVKIGVGMGTFGAIMIKANDRLDESGHITEGRAITVEEAEGMLIDAASSAAGSVSKGIGFGDLRAKGFASGLSYVPYDNYLALLHRGEQVLTRPEADQRRKGRNGALMQQTNIFHIHAANMTEDQIVEMVERKLIRVAMNMGGA